jgi:hypothetical protein
MERPVDAKSLARVRDTALSGGEPRNVRKVIRDSWQRAQRLGVRPDRYLPPLALPEDEIAEMRREHALARVWPLLSDTMHWATSEPGHLLFLSDAEGHLLWMEGRRPALTAAERIRLVPGALWSEDAAGPSGIGTTLTHRRPFQITGAEHYLSVATAYTCTGAPIRDPITGQPLGVIDLTCGVRDSGPMALSLLATAARLAEAELRTISLRRRAGLQERYLERLSRRSGTQSAIVTPEGHVLHADPPGWLPSQIAAIPREGPVLLPTGRPALAERLSSGGPFLLIAQNAGSGQALTFQVLGRDRALLHIAGVTHELSRRHSEILTVLLAHPGGLSADDLRSEVYGPAGKPVTLRAEIARVRSLLGHRLASEPYRLIGECHADFRALDAEVATGAFATLLDRYPGPLLPASSAPGVVLLRERLHQRLRDRLLRDGDTDSMTRWLTSRHGRADGQIDQARRTLRGGAEGG